MAATIATALIVGRIAQKMCFKWHDCSRNLHTTTNSYSAHSGEVRSSLGLGLGCLAGFSPESCRWIAASEFDF